MAAGEARPPATLLACSCGLAPLVVHWDADSLSRCPQCGVLSRRHPPSEQQLQRCYRDEYGARFQAEQTGAGRDNLSLHVLDWLERLHPARGVLLDVGCGGGRLLSIGRGRGWTVVGFEVGSEAVARARARGLTVHEQAWPPCPLPDESADAVTFVNVLDHLGNPFVAVREAWRVLRPGGLLYVRVPNGPVHLKLKRLAHGWPFRRLGLDRLPVMHLFGFGRAALRYHLGRVGFELLGLRSAPPSTAYTYALDASATGRMIRLLKIIDLLLYRGLAISGLNRWVGGLSLEAMACKPPRAESHVDR